ncbi:MAG TPA: hypothetical protein VMM58_04020 [Bacteroidota bacterium]|nr:hypothetical protein [Bacteroidota bacterium]
MKEDGHSSYCLEAAVGLGTIKVWKNKMRAPMIPVAWVDLKKSYVSYHLMGIYMNPKLQAGISKQLKARMQGKSCFNFNTVDNVLFTELDQLTARSIKAFKRGGYIS